MPLQIHKPLSAWLSWFLFLFCVPSFPGQAGLVLLWNMEQRGRSADTVSCQPLSVSASLRGSRSRSSTGQPKIWSSSPLDSSSSSCLCLCRMARASQTYLFPVHLTDQLLPSAVFYATVGPLLIYMAIHRLIIIPYTRAQKEESAHTLSCHLLYVYGIARETSCILAEGNFTKLICQKMCFGFGC